jgi:Eukaryotic-type carbonic anhydrase
VVAPQISNCSIQDSPASYNFILKNLVFYPIFLFTAQINVMDAGVPITISGGPLDGVYDYLNMHFNWAATDEDGSLHPTKGK